ncbi:peptidoglycan-binding domain-containing protein [Amphritea sp. 1_MG-2023]|uniref:peptidoglycan-binding domain-containing protein n=1 Tax=Amphritea sp. 1_MG-2023 TaxID=3062670 RepID=UPI0026E1BCD0|nr:peptidoglycan-binding domain-containing protein [Amphritea sp. 1_MG-2023]MDO6563880.1 peptidoglycan-binding domain-containing protein [Amphritea sp. 1_MG-2023]
MKITSHHVFRLTGLSAAIFLAACSTQTPQTTAVFDPVELEQRNQNLIDKEKALAQREAMLADKAASQGVGSEPLLPPAAKSGECYARVWVEPEYQTYTETVLVKEAGQRVEVVPAQYQTVTERLMVQPASFKMTPVPAKYDVVKEQKLIREAEQVWRIDKSLNSAPASQNLLAAAASHGIDLDAAKPGMCFHEHYVPAEFEQVKETVLTREAYEKVSVVPAKYRWVEKRVMVKEASSRIQEIPAQYKTMTEQVVDVPAHTVWKKGTGPIQKIDQATGEIMCLVDIPATYKTVSREVLVTPASTRTIEIPAEYKTVKVQELVSEAREQRMAVPAEYSDVALTKKVHDYEFDWHEVHDMTHPSSTRTGNKICLTETPAQYKTVERTVVVQPAGFKRMDIPEKYETVEVTKLAVAAQEKRFEIPAEYRTVTLSKLDKEGYMEWRSILCDTNMTTTNISHIQKALLDDGFDPGRIDGVIGRKTMSAVNDFQRANDLPVDEYINMETVKALGIRL